MAFLMYQSDDGRAPAIEYLPCSAIQPKFGMALTQSSGKLAIATGTTKPTYISLYQAAAAVSAGTIIPDMRVDSDIIFKTSNSASFGSINLGDKVTLHASSGMQVTATTTSGVAEVVGMDGTASGSTVYVRF